MAVLAAALFIVAMAWGVVCFVLFFMALGTDTKPEAVIAVFISDAILFLAAAVAEFFYLVEILVPVLRALGT